MKLKINDKEYNLTNTAILWKDRFESYTDDDTISFNKTNLDNKYIMTNEMFNCLYNDISQLVIDEEDAIDLGRSIRDIDNLQTFINEQGNKQKAIDLLEKGIILMLDYYNKKINEEIKKNGR
ncbi:MAG: hypothetical protein E7160_00545 [Firmicutes bacterium]|nr:hypothetical protein [Bacillota bacterium]